MTLFRRLSLVLLVALGCTLAVGQQHQAAAPQNTPQAAEPANNARSQASSSTGVSEDLAHASKEAAGEEEENAEFKQSPSVKFVAKVTGLSLHGAYWLLVFINFAIIAAVIGWAMKKNLPAMFRTRTETIRKSMEEARKASEEANRRLADIESRLAHLDVEIQGLRKAAESDAVAEEQRIRATTEEDARKVIEGAEQEIDAAAKAARRELKSYVADLAVSLAEKRIKVDPETDQALVHTFVHQLGKAGQ